MTQNIIEMSPNGNLRLRQLRNGKGVVELNVHGEWRWCVWRNAPMEQARQTFDNQVRFHQV